MKISKFVGNYLLMMNIRKVVMFCFVKFLTCLLLIYPGTELFADNTTQQQDIDYQLINVKKLLGKDNKLAWIHAEKALKMSKTAGDRHSIGESYFYLGLLKFYDDLYFEAVDYYDSAFPFYNVETDKQEISKIYHQKARAYGFMSDFNKAVEFENKAIELKNEINDRKGLVMCYSFLGEMHKVSNNKKKALENYYKARQYMDVTNDSIQLAWYFIGLGDVFKMNENYDSASVYYKKAYDIYIKTGEQRYLAIITRKMGICLMDKGEYNEAMDKFSVSLNIFQGLDEKYGTAIVLTQLSKLYQKQNLLGKAKEVSLNAFHIVSEMNNDKLESDISKQLSEIYFQLKQYDSAFYYLQKYTTLYEKIFTAGKEKVIQEMEHKFNISEKNRQIVTLQANNQAMRDKNLMIILSSVILIIVVASFLINYSLRNKSLKQRNEILKNEKLLREKESRLKEQDYIILKNKLESRNKELASKSLELLRYNETLKTITNKLEALEKFVTPEHKEDFFKLIKEVERFSKDNMWKEFETAFTKVHTEFYDKLVKQFPTLTPAEIKLAALLRLNFSTKEIAAVTFKSESSIKSIRHRLRKKMNLTSDSNLITFLLKL